MAFNLKAVLGLDGAGFKLGIKEAEGLANQFARNFKNTFMGIFAGFSAANLGSSVAGGIIKFFDNIIERSFTIEKQSKIWDMPIQKMALWERMASKLNIELSDITAIMSKLGEESVNAFKDPNSESAKAFAALGMGNDKRISMRDDEILEGLIRSAKDMNDPQKVNPFMRQLFGAKKWPQFAKLTQFDLDKEQSKTLDDRTIEIAAQIKQAEKDAKRAVEDAATKALAKSVDSTGQDLSGFGLGVGFGGAGNTAKKGISEAERLRDVEIRMQARRQAEEEQLQARIATRNRNQALIDEQERSIILEYDIENRKNRKDRLQKEGAAMASVMNRSDLSSFEKQGLFLRGAPTESINIPKQQLDVSKTIRDTVKNIDKKLATEVYNP